MIMGLMTNLTTQVSLCQDIINRENTFQWGKYSENNTNLSTLNLGMFNLNVGPWPTKTTQNRTFDKIRQE